MYGWVIAKNIDIHLLKEENAKRYLIDGYQIYVNVMNKFNKDTIFDFETENIQLLDGVILNKKELLETYHQSDWKNVFETISSQGDFPNQLRGCFNGVLYNKEKKSITAFTNQIGDRTVYYYIDNEHLIISSNYNYMLDVLKYNHISLTVNVTAAKYMLTYGYMLDDETFCEQIHRLLPGSKICINENDIFNYKIQYYFQIDNTVNVSYTEKQAIEAIDSSFRKAIKREFEKDREYGYRHLVDLSGGLDSRMTCWVADEMGYKDQVNISYCKSDYYDEKISKEIAAYLNHEYIFKYLDDKKFLYDIEEIMEKNFCSAIYFGITGGNRLLKSLNMQIFGLEHTGQVGDAILSTFYNNEEENYSKPVFGEKQYSKYLKFIFDNEILNKYENKELFAINTRGFLGACSSHLIRQNYTEVVSPFLDVDFMNTCFSIPFSMRKNHYIYLKWIEKKYPKALEFQWEKTRVKMINGWKWRSKIKFAGIKIKHGVEKILLKKQYDDGMNPFEYWYNQDSEIKNVIELYYKKNCQYLSVFDENERIQIKNMFTASDAVDKMLVMSTLESIKKVYQKI